VGILAGGMLPAAASARQSLKEGDDVWLDGRRCRIVKLDTLPYVQSDYTRRFKFDSYDNPKLKELRQRYRLDEVIAPGKEEFDRAHLYRNLVQPVPQMGVVRPDVRDVHGEGRRAAHCPRVPPGVVLPRRQGHRVRARQGSQALPQIRYAGLPRPVQRLRRSGP